MSDTADKMLDAGLEVLQKSGALEHWMPDLDRKLCGDIYLAMREKVNAPEYPFWVELHRRDPGQRWYVEMVVPNVRRTSAGPFKTKETAQRIADDLRLMFRAAWHMGVEQALSSKR